MAAMLRAVRLAEKCFEIARSTRFAGERASAISRGIAIAEKARLRLDLFSIPGRDGRHLQNALRDAEERWTAGAKRSAPVRTRPCTTPSVAPSTPRPVPRPNGIARTAAARRVGPAGRI
ncbi:hypothetical protein ACVOMT_16495 [Sphingomonas panni]